MPALFVTSFGFGMAAVTMTLTAVYGVAEDRTGVASALVNMAQQIGAALGLAVFTTLAVSTANGQMSDAPEALQEGIVRGDAVAIAHAARALTYGYTTSFLAGAGMLLVAAVIAIAAGTTGRTQGAAVPSVGLDP
ncbi:MFS transporter [Geminicoccus flavidas]|uniref:hypothetical protein n=1 Tax=Geminicoccus flavidas TaxID=2506407 RepID=UPI00190F78A4|nr:hypothetical protein [Geminicoccus flavidas]